MHDSLKRHHTLTVPVQRADSHKQVEEVGCPPGSWCPMEPKPPGQLRACQAACTAMHSGQGDEAVFGIRLSRKNSGSS
jgi:hypothetical protein